MLLILQGDNHMLYIYTNPCLFAPPLIAHHPYLCPLTKRQEAGVLVIPSPGIPVNNNYLYALLIFIFYIHYHYNGSTIDVVRSVKILGVTLQSNLKWNEHINNIVKKASKRLYFLSQLKRAKVPYIKRLS